MSALDPLSPVATVYDAMGQRPQASPPDVLGAIDDAQQKLRLAGCSYEQTIPLRAARRAFAELIEQARRADQQLARERYHESDPPRRDLRAALARIGGAA